MVQKICTYIEKSVSSGVSVSFPRCWDKKRRGQDLSCPSNPPWSIASVPSVSIVVDLGALELVGIVDVDGLPLGKEIDGRNGGFAVAVAGLLRAAEGEVSLCADRRGVHINNSGVEI